jgi:sugar (pentulose or hexulose) kinase
VEKDLVLAIDYGTQSVRVSIVDRFGKFLAFEKETYEEPYFSTKPGYCEQYPDYYYEHMCKAAKRLTSKNPELLKRVVAMSESCFRDTPVFLDENYSVVRPSIIWLDQRQAKLERKIPRIYTLLFWLVGMERTIVLNRKRTPALWLQENEPENRKKIKHYVPLSCYFNYRMLSVCSDGPSNMTGHFPIIFKTGKWYGKRSMKGMIFGIDPSQCPNITPTGEVVGYVTEKCHEETGFPIGLKFIATGNDKACEALGSGAISNDVAHVSYGTASSVSITTKRYINPEPFLPSYQCSYRNCYSAEVQVYRGYRMLKRFSKEFADKESVEAQIEKIAPEEILNEKLMDIPPGSNGLIVQPYRGPGLHRPLAKGAIIGFYDVHTKYHMYRAIIEGIAYALKEGVNGITRRTHKKLKYLTISGGGSRSDAICQITSDIFDLPVIKTDTYETSSLGCAMSIYLALGVYKTPKEAVDNMVKKSKEFYPNKENAKKYGRLFKNVYLRIYPSLEKSYEYLSEYLQKNNEGIVE